MATSISMVKRKVATWPDCWITSQWKSTLFWVRILCSSTKKKHVFSWKISWTPNQTYCHVGFPTTTGWTTSNKHGFSSFWASSKALVGSSNTKHAGAVAIASRPVRAPFFLDFLLEIHPNQRWNWWFAMICLWVSMRFPMKDKVGSTLGTLSVRDDGEHHPLVLTSGEFGPRPECWEIPRSRNPFHTHTHL